MRLPVCGQTFHHARTMSPLRARTRPSLSGSAGSSPSTPPSGMSSTRHSGVAMSMGTCNPFALSQDSKRLRNTRQTAMRLAFPLPRNPLLRALLLAAGGLMLIGLLFFGLIAGLAVVAFGALVLLVRRLLPRKSARPGDGDVIDGEFRVVDPPPRARIG